MMRKGEPHPMNAPVTTGEKLKEVQRELAMRRPVYDRAVKEGTMTVQQAGRRLGIMRAIVNDYRALLGLPPEALTDDSEAS
jgi:hypothetical protein